MPSTADDIVIVIENVGPRDGRTLLVLDTITTYFYREL